MEQDLGGLSWLKCQFTIHGGSSGLCLRFRHRLQLAGFTESGKPRGSLSAAIALMLLYAYLHATVLKEGLPSCNQPREK